MEVFFKEVLKFNPVLPKCLRRNGTYIDIVSFEYTFSLIFQMFFTDLLWRSKGSVML
jgi:hypothetical protein